MTLLEIFLLIFLASILLSLSAFVTCKLVIPLYFTAKINFYGILLQNAAKVIEEAQKNKGQKELDKIAEALKKYTEATEKQN